MLHPARRGAPSALILVLLLTAPAATALTTAGNGAYVVTVEEDSFASDCGTWTAQTGPLHGSGPALNVLFGDGFPGTSDTTLRSWSSGAMYRTGGASSCLSLCELDEPELTLVTQGGVDVGIRLEWVIVSGGDRFTFTQEVIVEGPVDGTETEENTVIRETHVVRNDGTAPLLHGLRKHWDWQVDSDDGPWFATCASPEAACDRSFRMFADGSGAGVPPRTYVINADPASASCPSGIAPNEPAGCFGAPIYLVAGTVGPPSPLVPPPDEPEALEFNSWPELVDSCWEAPLFDDAPCDDSGDTAIAYFYGLTSSSAHVLAPGEERSYTQYVVAATGGCPSILEPPDVVTCDAGGPYATECGAGPITLVASGTTTRPGAALSFAWSTTCAGALADADRPVAALLLDAACSVACDVTVTVSDGAGSASCSSTVASADTTPPVVLANRLLGACAWSPRHDRICLGSAGAHVDAVDACGSVAISWSGCASDQPDEAPEPGSPDNGDGRFLDDCIVSPDEACLRVERAGTDPEGRRYSLAVTVSDACGNAVVVPGDVHVPHDRRGGSGGQDDPCVRGDGARR